MAFEALPVDRRGIGSLQRSMTPQAVVDAGITSFGGAEMDFKTAPSVIESVRRFAEGGLYGFTLPQDGYLDPSWIVPAQGTIFSVAAVIRMATEPGDAIIVQPPVYYRYEQAARRLGRRTVYNRLRLEGDRYTMDFEDLERLMSDPRNKVLVVCNPHNPVGRVWEAGDLERIGELAERIVTADEVVVIFTGPAEDLERFWEAGGPLGWRDEVRAQELATTAADVRALACALGDKDAAQGVCVFGGRDALEACGVAFDSVTELC